MNEVNVSRRGRADGLLGADDVAAERVVAVEELVVDAADEVARRVEVHVHLLDDHALLALDLLGVEARVADHVDEDVERHVAGAGGALDVVARVLLAREGVELAADPVDLGRDVAGGRAPLGALEEHVLGEVGDAADLGRLVARACREHDEARDRLRLRHRRREHANAIGQRCSLEDGHRRIVDTRCIRAWDDAARHENHRRHGSDRLLVLVVVGLVVGIVLLGVWAVRRFVPSTRDGFDAEVSSQMMGVVASLFGLLLAFVVVIEFQTFSSAGDNVQTEADDLGAIVRDSYAFGPAGGQIRTAIGDYVHLVVDDEWPLMRKGKESAAAWDGLDDVFAAMQAYKPVSTSEVAFYDDSVRHLNAVLEARSNRLDSSGSSDLPALIAALILVGAVVILGYATLVGSKSSAFHAIGAGAIAVVIGFALVVLVALQFPFSGGLAVDSQPFREGALAPFFSPK